MIQDICHQAGIIAIMHTQYPSVLSQEPGSIIDVDDYVNCAHHLQVSDSPQGSSLDFTLCQLFHQASRLAGV